MNRQDIAQQATKSFNEHGKGIWDLSPRSGKTKIAIDALRDFKGKILVTYPYNVIGDVWISEMEKWNSRDMILCNQRSIPDDDFDLVICDEIHSLSENQIKQLKGNRILGLTGSLSKDSAKLLKRELDLDIIYTYTIEQAIEDGLISNYQITVVRLPLDDKDKYILAGNKKSKFYTTEKKNYEYLTKQFNKFRFLADEDPKYENIKMLMAGNRARAIYSYKTKIELAKQFIDGRCLVFTVLHETARQLCKDQYHSKSNGDELDKFINNEIDSLAVCNMVSMGKIYCEIEKKETLEEFLKEFFILTPKTWYDEARTNIQCDENKIRSFEDLLDIVNTVYEDSVSEMMLLEALDNLAKNFTHLKHIKFSEQNIECVLSVNYCFMITRIVFWLCHKSHVDEKLHYTSIRNRLPLVRANMDLNYSNYPIQSKYTPEYLLSLLPLEVETSQANSE